MEADVVKRNQEKEYYEKGRNWEADRQSLIAKSERKAWLVASVASVIAVLAVGAVVGLTPLKSTEPFVLMVDKATGDVEVLHAGTQPTVGYQELMDKHWAREYVKSRENYQWTLLQLDYDKVLAMSDVNVANDYKALYEGANARDKKYGQNTQICIRITSTTLPPDETGKAIVRYDKFVKSSQSGWSAPLPYVATLGFDYTPTMIGKEKTLMINPMGFRVTSYRVDEESTGVAAVAAAVPRECGE